MKNAMAVISLLTALLPLTASSRAALPVPAAHPILAARTHPSHATLKDLRIKLEVQLAQVYGYCTLSNPLVSVPERQIGIIESLETPDQVRRDQWAAIRRLRHEMGLSQQQMILDRAIMTDGNPAVRRLSLKIAYLQSRIVQLSSGSPSAAS